MRKGPAKVGEGVPSDCSSAGTLGPAVTSRSLFSGPDTDTQTRGASPRYNVHSVISRRTCYRT